MSDNIIISKDNGNLPPNGDGSMPPNGDAPGNLAVGITNGTVKALKILPVRNLVIYPYQLSPIILVTRHAVELIDDSVLQSEPIGIFAEKSPEDGQVSSGPGDEPDEKTPPPKPEDIHRTGTLCKILKMVKLPNNTVRVLVQGLNRCEITEFVPGTKTYMTANVKILKDIITGGDEETALLRNIANLFREVITFIPNYSEELQILVSNIVEPDKLTDLVAANLNIPLTEKQKILETVVIKDRAEIIHSHLAHELELLKLGSQIQNKVRNKLDQKQREFFLRQEMDAIKKELGESDEITEEINELKEKVDKAGMPEEIKEVAEKELNRLSKMQVGFAEYSVSRTYIEWLIELPWNKETEDSLDIKAAREILDKDHYDLKDVKEVILDFLAVKRLKKDTKSNILCLVGPPGVGKTSLGKSIAGTLKRKFVRMSLGGIHDEAEIRGHRRTYVGALPGRIIQGIRNAGAKNPVFMLDEIDKVGQDFRGDPSSALLEVLDPEQNNTFRDNYLEVSFDLSKVLFITTANMLDTIPPPLLDRMEVVHLSGYTTEEKIIIAKRYIIPRQITENGLKPGQLNLTDNIIKKIILGYTREAGVRNLEREIRKVCRKIARRLGEDENYNKSVTEKDIITYLQKPRFTQDLKERINVPGIATGMAWTPVGGTILFIESSKMPGKERLTLTGHLGDVMKESATIALNYIRSNAKKYKISTKELADMDIHIHVPEGATPKDGPSAGITIATSLYSLLTGRKVRNDIAMTGELTLRGKVLPIGGVKEKILAAKQALIFEIILPKENRKDIEEIDPEILGKMKFHYVSMVEEVFKIAVGK
jgi:ATP-dependent Lon protease